MIAGCAEAWGTGSFVAVAVAGGAEGSVVQGVDCSVVGGTRHSVAGGAESFGGASLVDFADHHPSPLLHFCKWSIAVPMSNFLWPV